MKKVLSAFFIFSIILPFAAIAGNGVNNSALHTKVAQWLNNNSGIRFLENKGQMMDMQRKPVPNVLYEANGGGMDVYVTNSGLSYVFVKLEMHKKKNSSAIYFPKGKEHNDSITETWCRADMQLVGADIRKENIVKEGESTDRSDYYYGDICPNGILGVHSYEKVIIKNIYPGIDWVLHGGKSGLKYDFIVHPGADPAQIKLKYKWTDKPQLQEDGSIKISTPMGNITEGMPVSYYNGEQVHTTYIVNDSEIYFRVDSYNTNGTLTIDPTLVWATYYGTMDEDVYAMQDDGSNVYLTGIVGSTNFPTFNPGGGAYFQGTHQSLSPEGNLFILQFNVAGVLKWATYYGGGSQDFGQSIYSDGTNVWVTGWTGSSNFPTLNPGGGVYFQGTPAAGGDCFILQFSTTGVRKWATYYGGNGEDWGYSINSDGSNIWVTGYTTSSNFPVLNPGGGAYFQGTIGGGQNAFILQFSTAGIRKWATYYGGNASAFEEEATSINSDGTNVWVTGRTMSSNFPTLNPGGGAYFQSSLNGFGNAFILQFSTAGIRKWATYYGGSGKGGDGANAIYSDGKNVWVTGTTYSPDFPTLNPGGGAYFQGTLAGTSNAFILKFNTTGVRKWATFYGGSGDGNPHDGGEDGYSIQSIGTDVWVCGFTASPDFPTLSLGCGYNDDTLGNVVRPFPDQDVFILQFDTTGVRKWATYYGADGEDDGSYTWSDGKNLFVAGDAGYGGYPTINPGEGAYYSTATDITGENIFIGKFILKGLGLNPTVSICRGSTTTLNASGAISYSWSPATGLNATNIPNPVASPTVTTTYTVTGTDTGTCGGTIIDSVKVIVDALSQITISKDTAICGGDSVILHASGGATYSWNTGATTDSISIPDASKTQTYTVSISNGACVKDTNVTVTVVPLPKPYISGNTKICPDDSILLTVSGGTSYKWSNGTTSNIFYLPSLVKDTTISVTAYNSLGCSHDTSITVIPESIPLLSACCDAIIQAGNDTMLVAMGDSKKPYQWLPPVTCLNPPLCDSVKVSPTVTTTYSVTMTDSAGCQIERFVTIVVDIPCTNLSVPNVFTPDYAGPLGINNAFYINTKDIDSWSIIIYDRWGKEMFHATNPTQFWNGTTESGGKAPDGVYYYIINATCRGNSFKKDGFVQLIR